MDSADQGEKTKDLFLCIFLTTLLLLILNKLTYFSNLYKIYLNEAKGWWSLNNNKQENSTIVPNRIFYIRN